MRESIEKQFKCKLERFINREGAIENISDKNENEEGGNGDGTFISTPN